MIRTSALVFLAIASAAAAPDRPTRVDPVAGLAAAAGRRLADLQPRSRRHALLAARRDHAGQRVHAGGGVGVPHEAGGTGDAGHARGPLPAGHETPPAPAPPRRQPAAGPTAPTELQPVARPPRLRLEREHAAGRRRRALPDHAVRPRRRARPGIGQGEVGVPAALGQPVDARPGVLARRRARRRRRSSSGRATPSSIRSTPRPASPIAPSATTASSTSTRPRSCAACPGATA